MLGDFYKNDPKDLTWWVEEGEVVNGEFFPSCGSMLFSFDRKEVFNLFQDYPYKLTKEQQAIFDKENPFWANFFKDRTEQKKAKNTVKK